MNSGILKLDRDAMNFYYLIESKLDDYYDLQ